MTNIFEDFNPASHTVQPAEVSDGWPRFLSVDPGGPSMLWAKSPDGVLYLLDQDTDQSTERSTTE